MFELALPPANMLGLTRMNSVSALPPSVPAIVLGTCITVFPVILRCFLPRVYLPLIVQLLFPPIAYMFFAVLVIPVLPTFRAIVLIFFPVGLSSLRQIFSKMWLCSLNSFIRNVKRKSIGGEWFRRCSSEASSLSCYVF